MKWLKANPDGTRPRDFWSPFRNALADGFASPGLAAARALTCR
ncbi:MAG: hypothetical protein RKP46_14825 [Candidatus Accumulibacter sp.]|nr:hypothetical protein [Accumulibacter sp.]MDS4015603.1 hypothetical protein [Accumulibacter sp.]